MIRIYCNSYIVMRQVRWLGSSRTDLKAFPTDARRVAGFQLHLAQLGFDPNDWKPLGTVGPGVREIRVHTAMEHRVIYVATFADAVYVSVREEDGQDARAHDRRMARARFRALLAERRGTHGT